jgi:citrate synthase
MNIDGVTAVVLELGFPLNWGRGIFIPSRSVGICAHAYEQSKKGERVKVRCARSGFLPRTEAARFQEIKDRADEPAPLAGIACSNSVTRYRPVLRWCSPIWAPK